MDQARLIIDPPGAGAWNMAVDQALLETANESGLITLRFYRWSEPTLSLGYFQNHERRTDHPASFDCPFVRRRTGGGAILHDQELTYSLCVPSNHRWSSANNELYELFHELIIDLLKTDGIEASLFRDTPNVTNTKSEHQASNQANSIDPLAFMCFRRRSPGDIVLKGSKVVGSAQRRAKNALLQHGSILLKESKFAPELPGLYDLSCFSQDVSKTIEKLTALLEKRLRMDLNIGMLTQLEKIATERSNAALFSNDGWNTRR